MSDVVRPFNAQDGGIYYLIRGDIRTNDFEILAQRQTLEEINTLAHSHLAPGETVRIMSLVKGVTRPKN